MSDHAHSDHVLAIASNNRGKIEELRSLLGDTARIVTLDELGLESPEETGDTFQENAELKARYVFDQTGLPSLADDSGLEVVALNGAPGVRSARFAGPDSNDAANRARLLTELRDVQAEDRAARFVSVIAIVDRNGHVRSTRGCCEGSITFEERGINGFGYDPLFAFVDGKTMAELPAEEKNRRSHRGQAMRKALPAIRASLGLDAP